MIPDWTPGQAADRIAAEASEFEFDTFVVGFNRAMLRSDPAAETELRKLKTSVGMELLQRWPQRAVDFRRPDVRLDIDEELRVRITAAPLFVAGRYRKLSRRAPASLWIHHSCRGRGCESCDFTGELSGPSIQGLISQPLIEATAGEQAFFHGLGREDTDARMLGEGRPFVAEIRQPRRRRIDLRRVLEESTRLAEGQAHFLRLALVDRTAVRRIKEARADKTYRAWIDLARSPLAGAREAVEALAGRIVEQRSPTRVMHRRGETAVRRRHVVASRWLGQVDGRWVWEVRAAAGTYIKELVSGDGGRTRPSLAEILGVQCTCAALDVLAIHWSSPWERD